MPVRYRTLHWLLDDSQPRGTFIELVAASDYDALVEQHACTIDVLEQTRRQLAILEDEILERRYELDEDAG